MRIKFAVCSAFLLIGTGVAGPAFASAIGWSGGDFTVTSSGSLGPSHTFSDTAGQSFTAYSGCASCTQAPDLYAKYTSSVSTETGLGLSGTANNEISYPNGILLVAGSNTQFTSLTIGSLQSSETWSIWGYSGASLLSSTFNASDINFLGGGNGGNSVSFSGSGSKSVQDYSQLIVSNFLPTRTPGYSASSCTTVSTNGMSGFYCGNNLLMGVTAQNQTSVPEPATLGLMGFALVGAGLAKWKRRAPR